MFVTPDGGERRRTPRRRNRAASAFDAERPGLRLADVAGMADVKARLEAAFLAPMRNPELRKLYGKSLRGGLLLYGPPGCGKTFIARAVAGELGARFMAVSFADVVDMYIGSSERNIHEIFETARRELAVRRSSSTRSTPSARSAASCAARRCAVPSTSCCSSSTTSPAATTASSC